LDERVLAADEKHCETKEVDGDMAYSVKTSWRYDDGQCFWAIREMLTRRIVRVSRPTQYRHGLDRLAGAMAA